jgi:DNA repair photolyase
MKPIYEPKARAKEYGDFAINIYTGCNHGCTYCYAPRVLHKTHDDFIQVKPRDGIIEAVKQQLEREHITNKLIHLCFTCDPYPAEIDTTPTREIIKLIKDSGNHVQILTKGGSRAERDFDLLDENDWFGVTYSGYNSVFEISNMEPYAALPAERLHSLGVAHKQGVKTWMSCEPVINEADIYSIIELADYIDLFKIGKLNYMEPQTPINWGEFGRRCERYCIANKRNYYIKEDLRKEMNDNPDAAQSRSEIKAGMIRQSHELTFDE